MHEIEDLPEDVSFWRDVYCAATAHPFVDPASDAPAKLADTALERFRARFPRLVRVKTSTFAEAYPELFREFSKDAAPDKWDSVESCRKHTVEEVLSEPFTPSRLARTPNLPMDLLLRFAESSDPSVLERIGYNPDLPEEYVRKLAAHDVWSVRQSVAQRPDLPADLYQQFATDPELLVRWAFALHPYLPGRFREMLANDPDPNVSKAARQHSTDPAQGDEA